MSTYKHEPAVLLDRRLAIATDVDGVARDAYVMADTMLKAREA